MWHFVSVFCFWIDAWLLVTYVFCISMLPVLKFCALYLYHRSVSALLIFKFAFFFDLSTFLSFLHRLIVAGLSRASFYTMCYVVTRDVFGIRLCAESNSLQLIAIGVGCLVTSTITGRPNGCYLKLYFIHVLAHWLVKNVAWLWSRYMYYI